MGSFFKIIKNLIFVPTCASCNERLSPIPEKKGMTYDKVCLCNSCQAKWEMAKAQMCHKCGNISESCVCVPKYLTKGQPRVPSLCFYHPGANDTQSNIIITMKRKNDRELFEFLAIELYPRLKKALDEMTVSEKDIIFTWVPRSGRAAAKSGFDQGEKLAKAIAALFGVNAYPLFLRMGGREQKKLSKADRKKNAERSIKANTAMLKIPLSKRDKDLNNFIKGKSVVIIDDVLTTGSTLRRAIEILAAYHPAKTVVACVAKTEDTSKGK